MPSFRRFLAALVAGLGLWLLWPGFAWAPPVAAAAAAIGTFLTASTIAAVVARFVLSIALSYAVNKLFGPKTPKAQARQAAVTSLQLGENARKAIFGEAATGGDLLDAFNFGGQYGTDWEVLVVKVADHRCHSLVGFYIGDTYYPFSANGIQSGFNNQLEVYWHDGAPGQAASSYLLTNSASRIYGTPWTSDDRCASLAYVVVAYKADKPNADNPVWPQGRPSFKWRVKGKLCYDPRLDPTVGGEAVVPVAAFCFVIDLSGSMGFDTPTRLSTLKAALGLVMDALSDAVAAGGVYDIAVAPFGASTGAGITRRAATVSDIADIDAYIQARTATAGDTDFEVGADKAKTFFDATDPSFTDRRLFFITDGEPTRQFSGASAATIAGEAAAVLATLTGVASYGINIALSDTTYTAMIDNTAADGVPVIDSSNPAALRDAIDLGAAGHRWTIPSTWEWTDNAAICDYNFDRGIYAEDKVSEPKHLLIGRGLTAAEADPARVAARANLCDEAVALKVPPATEGATEARYRVGGVIFSDESFREVKQKFADAMGGEIVKRNGGVEVLPGQSQSVVRELTDDDFVIGEPITFEPFLAEADRVNTVIPRYIAPDQLWELSAAPARRSTEDIVTDGGLKLQEMPLDLVTSHTQAQRIGEIKRRLGRKEMRFARVLSPKHADLEDGDWVSVTSDRYLNGGTANFRIEAYGVQQSWRNAVVLREIAASCYAWDPDTDEGTPGEAPVDEFGSLEPVELSGVDAFAIAKEGASGARIPAVRFIWDAPVDPAITRIRAEVREVGQLEVAPTLIDDVDAGTIDVTNGVGPDQELEARLVPLGIPGRKFIPSDWIPITSVDFSEAGFRAFLWTIALNLWRFDFWVPQTGAVAVGVPPADPFTDFGDQQMAIEIAGGAPGTKVVVDRPDPPDTFGLKSVHGGLYAHSFMGVTTDAGGSTIRVGFRDAANNPISDLTDQVYALTTTPTLFKWENIESDDPDFATAKLVIYDNSGDIDTAETATLTELMFQGTKGVGTYIGPFRPSPDEDYLLRYEDILLVLFAAERVASKGKRLAVRSDGLAYEHVPVGVTWSPDIAGTSHTLRPQDVGAHMHCLNAALTTITLPADADADIPVNAAGAAYAEGAGLFVFAAGAGATVLPAEGGVFGPAAQYGTMQWKKSKPNTYVLI